MHGDGDRARAARIRLNLLAATNGVLDDIGRLLAALEAGQAWASEGGKMVLYVDMQEAYDRWQKMLLEAREFRKGLLRVAFLMKEPGEPSCGSE